MSLNADSIFAPGWAILILGLRSSPKRKTIRLFRLTSVAVAQLVVTPAKRLIRTCYKSSSTSFVATEGISTVARDWFSYLLLIVSCSKEKQCD